MSKLLFIDRALVKNDEYYQPGGSSCYLKVITLEFFFKCMHPLYTEGSIKNSRGLTEIMLVRETSLLFFFSVYLRSEIVSILVRDETS